MSEIISLSLEQLATKIKDAQLSSVDVCKAFIERIEKYEKAIKAWAHFDKKVLLEKAEEADEHRRSGKPLGSLHGVPVAVKDIVGTIDMPTECGTVIRKGKSYSQNAEIIDMLHSAGALVMGKTATSELAFLGPPATTNPHEDWLSLVVLKRQVLMLQFFPSLKHLLNVTYQLFPHFENKTYLF